MASHDKNYHGDRLFRFVWRTKKADGTPDVNEGYGRDVADAFTRLGYGGGAAAALDYHEEVTTGHSTQIVGEAAK